MAKLYEFEITKGAHMLVNDYAKVKPGETVVLTCDTEQDERVVNAIAGCVHAAGGKPMVLCHVTPQGVGKAADAYLPVEAMSAALCEADVWFELNVQYLLYSTPYIVAKDKNKRLRHFSFDLSPDMMERLISRVDVNKLRPFWERITEMTRNAKRVRITNPGGTDIIFDNDPNHPIKNEDGNGSTPGSYMLPGQISWAPAYDTINGTLAFDGSLVPNCGLLSSPVVLTIENGVVKKVSGGPQAAQFEEWLASFDDPNMYRMAHVCYGFHPTAKLTGNITEDERVWGCTEWGIGYFPDNLAPPKGIDAKSHTDGICLNSSVWLDDVQVLDEGNVVHPELTALLEE